MNRTQTAFLDALAEGESSGRYDVLYGGGTFSDFSKFPEWSGKDGPAGVSLAAGRYQFDPATWAGEQTKLGLPDFSPASQDEAAWDLADTVYHHRTARDLEYDLEHGQLDEIESALHSTWTSIGPSFPARFKRFYGQSKRSSTMPTVNASHVAAAGLSTAMLASVVSYIGSYLPHPLPTDAANGLAGLIALALSALMAYRQGASNA